MSDKRPLPETPRPGNGGNACITDYFKSIERTDNGRKSKRKHEDEENDQSPKRFKRSNDGHAGSIKTARYQVKVDTPKTRKPVSARLLDDTDGGLYDSLVGRRNFLEREAAEDDMGPRKTDIERDSLKVDPNDTARRRRSKAPSPRLPTPRPKKKSSSARLFDDTDGGLIDALAGRFETTRNEEPVPEDQTGNINDSLMHQKPSDEPTTTENNNIDATLGDQCRTPSPQRPLTTPKHHSNQRQEEHNSSPISRNDSPSPFLLPSSVVDLPAPESSPVAFPSSPLTQ
ncbi:hypothetical protein GE21DRAFT_1273651 [Neurospora crassa]|nr:hypothetical protein GE21DRAFT_1273651 [Neurospora crassa]